MGGGSETYCSQHKLSTALSLLQNSASDGASPTPNATAVTAPKKKRGIFSKIFGATKLFTKAVFWPIKTGFWIGKKFIIKPAWTIVREFLGPALFIGIGAVLIFSCTGMFPPGVPLCAALGGATMALYAICAVLIVFGVFSMLGKLMKLPVLLIEAL